MKSVLMWSLLLIGLLLVQQSLQAGQQQQPQDDKKDDDKKATPSPVPTATPLPTATPAPKDDKDDKATPSPKPTATPLPTATPKPKDDKDDKDDEKETPKEECCKCAPTPTPTPTPLPAVPCKMVCQDGFVILKVRIPNVAATGRLAEYIGLDKKAASAKLTVMFKPDFVEHEESDKPKQYWLSEKGAYCFEVFKEDALKFSVKGSIANDAEIKATLSQTKDRVTIVITDAQYPTQSITVVLKKGANGFEALEHVLNESLAVGNVEFDLVADLIAHVEGQKDKDMDLSAMKIVSDVAVNKCRAKAAPQVCPPCTGSRCGQIKKCQVSIKDTKEAGIDHLPTIKLDAAWRTCNNRTNTRKSNDFLISLISIKECTAKDQVNCPRSIVDFSGLVLTGGSPSGIPTESSPVVTLEGKLSVNGAASGNKAYIKMIITLRDDKIYVTIQLNKNDKWQWIPSDKYNVLICTFKVYGQMRVAMLPKSSAKSDTKTVEFELTDNVRVPVPTKTNYHQDFVVKTKLTLDFPIKASNGQVCKIIKTPYQQNKATLVTIEFNRYHFDAQGILNYGPIVGEVSFKQLSKTAAAAEEAAGANVEAEASSDELDNERQAESSACSMDSWFNML